MRQTGVPEARALHNCIPGTAEFICDQKKSNYYFLKKIPRLQVEHPITELVAGIDLVQWQIRVAAGENFPFKQSDFIQRGHAIECRVYAEDPANGFLPSTGKLLQYIEPRGPGIRVDSGFAAGNEVTHFYDPLLAKLIVHAENREAAVQKMQQALREFVVHGVVTNIDFMQAVLAHDDFIKGKVTTRWVEKALESNSLPFDMQERGSAPDVIAATLADVAFAGTKSQPAISNETDPFSPWKQMNNYRN